MLTKIKSFIDIKLSSIGRTEQLFIIPTLDGLKLLVLNLILLVIGLIYANNYVLLFNFILFSLFIASMYYTHFNLQGLKLVSAKISPIHASESGILSLSFKSKSGLGHYFLNVRFKDKNILLINPNSSFSLTGNTNSMRVDIPVRGVKRGVSSLPKISIETYFPFHLFKSFVYFKHPLTTIVYPAKINSSLVLKNVLIDENKSDGDDYILNEYKEGDSLKRVSWKKVAQANRWYSKKLIVQSTEPILLTLSANDLSGEILEQELSTLSFTIHQLHSQEISYGLSLGRLILPPDHSQFHLNNCLRALAEYEN